MAAIAIHCKNFKVWGIAPTKHEVVGHVCLALKTLWAILSLFINMMPAMMWGIGGKGICLCNNQRPLYSPVTHTHTFLLNLQACMCGENTLYVLLWQSSRYSLLIWPAA